MKKFARLIAGLLILLNVLNFAIPMPADAASRNFGVIISDSKGIYQLYSNLIVISPSGHLMLKASEACSKLGLIYSYNNVTKKITIKNPVNGKYLVFTLDNEKFTYYPPDSSKGQVKTAKYKAYYDTKEKCDVIHIGTLKYILGYKYYNNLEGNFYDEMGYKAIAVYNINIDNISELPVTGQLTDYINSKTFRNKDELLDAVRINLVNRNTNVTLKTNREVMEQLGSKNSIYSMVISIDNKNTAKDADYLSLLIDRFGQRWQSSSKILIGRDGSQKEVKSKNDPATLTIDVAYETTLEQEAVVDVKIAAIIKELKLNNASDYQKVKKIHDYIINNSKYDTTLQKGSAYDLLVHKTAVCEGYALVAYRLFLAAGLESKIISGTADGQPHAWNIVKVDGKWYNIDVTWDDPVTSSGRQVLRYDYFLKSDNDFPKHERSQEFNTAEFRKAYPIASSSYPLGN